MTDIYKVSREVNGIAVEQRVEDGFINATAMCVAHGKRIGNWLRLESTYELFSILASNLCIRSNNSDSSNLSIAGLSAAEYGEIFPGLIVVRHGSPENGGGVWLIPDLAIQLAQWCNPGFALQVSRWVIEWLTPGKRAIPQSNTPEIFSLLGEMSEVVESHIQASQALNRAIHTAIHQQTDTLRNAFQKTKELHQKTLTLPSHKQSPQVQVQPEPLSNLVQLTPRLTSLEKRQAVTLFLDLIEELPMGDERKTWSSRKIGQYLGVSYRTVINIRHEREGKRQPPKYSS